MARFRCALIASTLAASLFVSQIALADPKGLSLRPDEAQAVLLGVHVDQTPYTSTMSAEQACAAKNQLQDSFETNPHAYFLMAYSGVAAGLLIDTLNEKAAVQSQAKAVARAVRSAHAAEKAAADAASRISSVRGLGERITIEGGESISAALKRGGYQKLVGAHGRVYATLQEFVNSGEFVSSVLTNTKKASPRFATAMANPKIQGPALNTYLRELDKSVAKLNQFGKYNRLLKGCVGDPAECAHLVQKTVYGLGHGFTQVASEVEGAARGTIQALDAATIRATETRAIQEAFRDGIPTSCVKFGAQAFKVVGVASAVLTELTTASRSYAALLEDQMLENPSLLFTPDNSSKACGYLERSPELRERFARMIEVAHAAKQVRDYGDDQECGGPNDAGMRDTEIDAQVAMGSVRRAQASDFKKVIPGNDPFAERIREGMATSAQVVPVTE